jgi:predicted GNAT family N-acyltransferase
MSQYRVRSLGKDELESWLDFVHKVFAEAKGPKAPARSYFRRHIDNDPEAAQNLSDDILVAVDERGELIGTLRLFRRRVYVHRSIVSSSGVGEVCVRSDHRRRGVASQMLQEALRRMQAAKVELSFLHTSSSESIYRSLGWVSIPQRFAKLLRTPAFDHRGHIEPLRIESDDDIRVCSEMYESFSMRFDGCIVRDNPDYWRKWFRAESGDVAWQDPKLTPVRLRTRNKEAYGVFQARGDVIYVREFIVREKGMGRAGLYLDAFLSNIVAPELHTVPVVLPEPLLGIIEGSSLVVETFIDTGQMYRVIAGDSSAKHILPQEENLVFWATDAF